METKQETGRFFLGLSLFIAGGMQLFAGSHNWIYENVKDHITYWGGCFEFFTGLFLVGAGIFVLTKHENR